MEYNHKEIEPRVRQYWKDKDIYRVDIDPSRPKYYVLDMFPYPSGAGLHVGHPLGYISSDIFARYKRLCGFNVLHPMGYDAYGLPAEQYAIQTGQHPEVTTRINVERYGKQLDNIGLSFDWSRQIRTCDPEFYKWTQWAFLRMFESYYDTAADRAMPVSGLVAHFEKEGSAGVHAACGKELHFTAAEWNAMSAKEKSDVLMNYRLAYLGNSMVNWCPKLGTVLANDEVSEGVSVRGGYPVEQKEMWQWFLRVSAYAERLLKGLDRIDWSDSIKETQRNWIGRSEGAEMHFRIDGRDDIDLEIFTTRADTVFGVTFMVLAPDGQLVRELMPRIENKEEVEAYIAETLKKNDMDRTELNKTKSGCRLKGIYAVNPVNGREVPVFIGDFVLASYGTGAVMAVPTHDQRDFEYAVAHNIPMIQVIDGADVSEHAFEKGDYLGKGCKLINSEEFTGLTVEEAKKAITDKLVGMGIARRKVNYHFREWIFARQRYWGEPVPIVYLEDGSIHVLADDELPLVLPELEDYKGKNGQAPLENATEWKQYNHNGLKGRRETSTMPGSAGSSWYYMRYIDPDNDKEFADQELLKHWMPVDLYIGGPEHAVGHLMYSRIWNRFLYDKGLSPVKEPFKKLVHQGMILGSNGIKMGKRFPEFVVNPSDIVRDYGADTLRLYEMFMGPLEASKPWSATGVEGAKRFIVRVWNFFTNPDNISDANKDELTMLYHQTVKKVTNDFENLAFNTAISQMMIFVNQLYKTGTCPKEYAEGFIKMLSCICPHVGEELWSVLGHDDTIAYEAWPQFIEELTVEDAIEIAVQINGKTKGVVKVSKDADKDTVLAAAKDAVKEKLTPNIVKEIYVPGKIVNIVCK